MNNSGPMYLEFIRVWVAGSVLGIGFIRIRVELVGDKGLGFHEEWGLRVQVVGHDSGFRQGFGFRGKGLGPGCCSNPRIA